MIIGLGVDVIGASLTVSVDTKYQRIWEREEIQEEADRLRTFRSALMHGSELKSDDRGFNETISAISKHRSFSTEPDALYDVEDEVRASKGEHPVTVSGGSSDSHRSTVGPLQVVDSWLVQEIQEIEQSNKQPIRHRGLILILLGFVIQIIGYIIIAVPFVQRLLQIPPVC